MKVIVRFVSGRAGRGLRGGTGERTSPDRQYSRPRRRRAGRVMPGVSITISSPVLVAGSMTGVTDAGGVNRFPSLVPGTYTVKVELSGFQPPSPARTSSCSSDRRRRSSSR